MLQSTEFYIDGQWVAPHAPQSHHVINPATEEPAGVINLGDATDVDRAVQAAHRAFAAYARSRRQDRIALLEEIRDLYQKRMDDMGDAIRQEMGAPAKFAVKAQAGVGLLHLNTTLAVLKDYAFETMRGAAQIVHEPIGVCALITPWNWPVNQIAAKTLPALACGCTMVLKPSENTPFSAKIWAEIFHAAGVPQGVFNMVHGLGPVVGAAMSEHPLVDMVSFTGSTRAGIDVAQRAATTVKRVHQELGGKSPNILLPDADFEQAVARGLRNMVSNSGQSCNAPSRMLVPHNRMNEAIDVARATAAQLTTGDPLQNCDLGPVVSERQYTRIQNLIAKGIEEGATLVAGGLGRPHGLNRGYYVQPTVFAHVTNDMTIAREEIFGPVLSIIGYTDVEEAIQISNDTVYGLAAYVQGKDSAQIKDVVSRLRAGQVSVNYTPSEPLAPFGGFKQSGNGREWGDYAFEAYLEPKAIVGMGTVE